MIMQIKQIDQYQSKDLDIVHTVVVENMFAWGWKWT